MSNEFNIQTAVYVFTQKVIEKNNIIIIILVRYEAFTEGPGLRSQYLGWNSSVGIATRYGMDGHGIDTWWGRDFLHPFRTALGPTQPPIQ
jgi:hypothetical protein